MALGKKLNYRICYSKYSQIKKEIRKQLQCDLKSVNWLNWYSVIGTQLESEMGTSGFLTYWFECFFSTKARSSFVVDRFSGGGFAAERGMAELDQHVDVHDEEEALSERRTQRRNSRRGRSEDDWVLQQRRHRNLHPHRHEYGSNFISFVCFFLFDSNNSYFQAEWKWFFFLLFGLVFWEC